MKNQEMENLIAAFPGTYLTFKLNRRVFGFEAPCLWEISLSVAVSPLPPSSPFLAGVTHLHGKIVPVLDLCAILELPALISGSVRGFVAVRPAGWEAPAGFYIGEILGFEKFPEDQVSPGPPPEGGLFRKGYVDTPNRRVELLDMERILSSLRPSAPVGAPGD